MRHIPLRPAVVLFLLSLCVWTAFTVPSHGQQWAVGHVAVPGERLARDRARQAGRCGGLARASGAGSRGDCRARASRDRQGALRRGGRGAAAGGQSCPAQRRRPRARPAAVAPRPERRGLAAPHGPLPPVGHRPGVALPRRARGGGPRSAGEAKALFRFASASAGSAINSAWGVFFLETHNSAEAVKSFQQALAQDPDWAPAHAGLARAGRGRSAGRGRRRDAGARDRSAPRGRGAAARRARSRQHPLRRGEQAHRARPRVESVAARRARARGRDHVRPRRPCGVRRGGENDARDQSRLRRDLSRRRGARGAELPVRRCGGAGAGGGGARSDERAGACRARHAPDAHGRRGAGASVARSRVQDRSVRRRHLQPPRAARHARQVRRDPRRRHHPQAASRRGPGDARVRDAARAEGAQDAVGEVRLHAEGADPRRDVPEARRLRGAHAGTAGHDRRARRLLRPRRHAGLAARARPRARSRGRRRCGTR